MPNRGQASSIKDAQDTLPASGNQLISLRGGCLPARGKVMPASKAAHSDRWKAAVRDEVVSPVGREECAQSAVDFLGPFEFKTHEEAGRRRCRNKHGRIIVSEQLAWESVWILARNFNRQQL